MGGGCGGGGSGVHSDLWKNTLIEWSLSWKIIPLFWLTDCENYPFWHHFVQDFFDKDTLFHIFAGCDNHLWKDTIFRVPNWVIWVTQPAPKMYLFTPISRRTWLLTQVPSAPPPPPPHLPPRPLGPNRAKAFVLRRVSPKIKRHMYTSKILTDALKFLFLILINFIVYHDKTISCVTTGRSVVKYWALSS